MNRTKPLCAGLPFSPLLFAGVLAGTLGIMGCGRPNDTTPSAETSSETTAPASTGAFKPYPLDVCLVSGQKLGSMGTSPSIVHEGREIKFCCAGCISEFRKDPAKYLKKLPQEGDK